MVLHLHPGRNALELDRIRPGDVRVMLAVDYALRPSLLAGGRLGYVLNSYTGNAAVENNRALGPKIHVEVRATYLFGRDPLAHTGFDVWIVALASCSRWFFCWVAPVNSWGSGKPTGNPSAFCRA